MKAFLTRRWILFAITVALLAFLAYRLGEWQFDRLEDREARNSVTVRNLADDPLPVEDVLAVGRPVSPEHEWQPVEATGTYAEDETVIIRYQTRDGRAGVDVVTPLVTGSGAALLVDRGWLATGNVGTTRPDVPPAPEGEVNVVGWVRADATGDEAQVADQSARSVSSSQIARTVPFPVFGGFVDLRSQNPEAAEPLLRAETPDLSEGPHFFYGLQWWFFAALAVFGFFYLAWDERRKAKAPAIPPVKQTAGAETEDVRS